MADEVPRDANGYDAEGNWLECLPWEGQEKSLPLGYTTQVPGLGIDKFVYRIEVLDAEEMEGYREVKRSELKPTDIIVGAVMNENSIKKVVDTYGGDWIRLKEPSAGASLNRMQWRDKFGTDGLELLAIKSLRGQTTGTLPPTQNISASTMKPTPPPMPVYKIG